MQKKLLTVAFFILFASFISPQSVFAETNNNEIDKDVILILLEQVRLLSQEVTKLQSQLNNFLNPSLLYDSLSNDELKDVISSSVSWFKNAQEATGHFRYEFVPYENSYLPLDNIVRQAGGLYALGEVALYDEDNIYELQNTLQSGIRYFDSLSKEGEWNGYSFRCITNSNVNELCQLGATGLALVGLIDMVTRYPELEETYDDLIHEYGNYLLSMKKEGSGFRHSYVEGIAPSERESSFSNGEALLGLVRYYKYSSNEETKKAIEDTFNYFNSEEVEFDFPLYLWAMAAVKDMQELWPKDEHVKYVEDYTDWRISGFAYRKGTGHNMCAYVEGVLSAYSVLDGNIEASKLMEIEREINYWLKHSRKLQISEEDEFRILSRETGENYFGKIEDMERAVGGFLTDENELTQRIDFTQHCMNSYLQQLVDVSRVSL